MAKKKETKKDNPEKGSTKFQKGNSIWQMRSTHGREKIFKTPQAMWEAACEYFQYIDDNPFESKEITTSMLANSTKVKQHKRPYTLEALTLFMHVSLSYFRVFKHSVKNKDKPSEIDLEYLTVIGQIEQTVYAQKFEGASAGLFNNNIIARDLGLIDKSDQTSNGETINKPAPLEFKDYKQDKNKDE